VFERFAQAARSAVDGAKHEAGRRGDRRIGTEHLLLALLQDEAFAQLVGVDAATADETADRLDREALAAIGLAVGPFDSAPSSALARHNPRMTPGAKAVIQQALVNATTEKARAITTRHILLALLDRHDTDPAASLLAALNVDRSALRGRLNHASL
jgi:ATP-dependent Clp protease ATP-binding subunit ClpA